MKRKKTYSAKPTEVKRNWYLMDAGDKILGRVAVKAASVLWGKNKPMFTHHIDTGDYIVLINAGSVKVSGKKAKEKVYFSHSNYPGGARLRTFEEMMKKDPRKVIRKAVRGMLPKGRLGNEMIKKLHIFTGDKHTLEGKEFKTL